MSEEEIKKLKNNIVTIGHLLWAKELVTGLNGNISARIDEQEILLTGRGSCLGLLQETDVIRMNIDGTVLEEGQVSSERLMHTEIYKNYPEVSAIVHTHTTYTNAYFLHNDVLDPKIFESKFYLGEVRGIPQSTPSVTDAAPIVEALKGNNVIVLKHHGVVAVGKEHFDCFLLIQALEEAVKIDAISRLYGDTDQNITRSTINDQRSTQTSKYQLFSQEQIDEIVRLVNEDQQISELGKQTNMTMDLAVKLDETQKVYSFNFKEGKITDVGEDENVEFLINAPEKVWRQVFNQEIDPFVATTQKKMHLKGEFAKISKFYAPCSRLFELWALVPVE